MAIVGMIFMNSGVARVMYKVLMPKLFPKTIVERMSKGMEIHKDIVLTSMPKMEEQTMEKEEVDRQCGDGCCECDPGIIPDNGLHGSFAFIKRTQ